VRIAPESPEVGQNVAGAPEPQLVGRDDDVGPLGALQAAPGPTECLNADRIRGQLSLQVRASHRQGVGVRRSCGRTHLAHCRQYLLDVGFFEAQVVERPRKLRFVSLGPECRLLSTCRTAAVADAPVAVAGVAMVAAATAEAAHQARQRVGTPTVGATAGTVGRAALRADRLDALEQIRVDRRFESRRLLLLVSLALVADGAAGIERIGQDLRESSLGQAEFVSEIRVTPGAGRIQLEGTADAIEIRPFNQSQQLALPYSREAERRVATGIGVHAPLLVIAAGDIAR